MPKPYSRLPTRRNWRPDAQQELLLLAALGNEKAAQDAWEQWQHTADLATLDWGSRRLLPLVRDAVGEPQHADNWIENQLLFQETATLILLLRQANIEVLVLKGVALAHLYYRDAALRPMTDVDLLVRPQDAARAIGVMTRAGWTTTSSCRAPEHLIPFGRTAEFRNSHGTICDLHWRTFRQGRQRDEEDLWGRSIALEIAGTQSRTLDPADQLLLVCVHGADWNDMPTIRWVADATMIVRSGVDWRDVVGRTRERRLMLPMAETLEYLRAFVQVPEDVLRAIREMPSTGLERWQHRARIGPHKNLHSLQLAVSWISAWRAVPGPVGQKLLAFLKYLQALWDVESLWHTPFRLIRKCFEVVGRMVLRKGPAPRPRSSA